jgi:hypothetical protein
MKRPSITVGSALLVVCSGILFSEARGWDSARMGLVSNPTHSTHSYLTEWAVDQLANEFPEANRYRDALIEGANTELHERPSRSYENGLGRKYGLDLEPRRNQHKGTNSGCDDIRGWWQDSLASYRQGRKEQAYFLLGVLLHMVEDMGVPAHANGIIHQGNASEFDNFEFLAALNWNPSFDDIDRKDPGYADPWKYYEFSRDWTRADAPDYKSRDAFPKFWLTANGGERALVSNRQGRTCHVTKWVLKSASNAFSAAR